MPLHFFQVNGDQVALQGVHALLEPGVYPLLMEATLAGWKQAIVRADGAGHLRQLLK